MELVGIEYSRVVALFLASRPKGQPSLIAAAAALAKRYSFLEAPSQLSELAGEKVHFGHGTFDGSPIESFDVYSDGIIAASKINSAILDMFIVDVCAWMEDALGLRRIETTENNKTYESSLLFRSDWKISAPLNKLSKIQKELSKGLAKTTGLNVEFQPTGLTLGCDTTQIAGLKPIPFRIDRRPDTAFSKNLYMSLAPLPTDMHLELLEHMEELG